MSIIYTAIRPVICSRVLLLYPNQDLRAADELETDSKRQEQQDGRANITSVVNLAS